MRKPDDIVICVAGGFDPLHEGHLEGIKLARELGTYLIAIVSRDDQLIAKKGYFALPLKTRLAVVSSLKWVDEVFVNCDVDGGCAESLRQIRPHKFAKGGDRDLSNLPRQEIDLCAEIGCDIVCGLGDKIASSSELAKSWGSASPVAT